jgi:hypothetical protein
MSALSETHDFYRVIDEEGTASPLRWQYSQRTVPGGEGMALLLLTVACLAIEVASLVIDVINLVR